MPTADPSSAAAVCAARAWAGSAVVATVAAAEGHVNALLACLDGRPPPPPPKALTADSATLWMAGRAFERGTQLSDRVGSNEKTKVRVGFGRVVALQYRMVQPFYTRLIRRTGTSIFETTMRLNRRSLSPSRPVPQPPRPPPRSPPRRLPRRGGWSYGTTASRVG